MNKLIQYTVVFALLAMLSACSSSVFVSPNFLKIYLFNDSYENNMLVLDAFSTAQGGALFFAVQGNVSDKFDQVNELVLFEVDEAGDVLWRKNYSQLSDDEDIPFGFPSNILKLENEYKLFWSDYTDFYLFTFSGNAPSQALSLSTKAISCDFDAFGCGAAFKIEKMNAQDEFSCLSFQKNLDDQELQSIVSTVKAGVSGSPTVYETSYIDLFPNLDVYDPAVQFEEYFWLRNHNEVDYLCTAKDGKFTVLSRGNNKPIYQDETYWLAASVFYDEAFASVVVPQNERAEEGLAYFLPKVELGKYGQSFSGITAGKVVPLQGLSPNAPITLTQINEVFVVGGTSNAGAALVIAISKTGEIIGQQAFGAENSYQLNAIRPSTDEQHVLIIGTTPVKNQYQRPFLIKMKKSELRKYN